MAIDYTDLKGSKEKEDGLQVGELEPIPCQKRKLVHNLRAVHQNISQGLNMVEENCSSPAQATMSLQANMTGLVFRTLGKRQISLEQFHCSVLRAASLSRMLSASPAKLLFLLLMSIRESEANEISGTIIYQPKVFNVKFNQPLNVVVWLQIEANPISVLPETKKMFEHIKENHDLVFDILDSYTFTNHLC